MIVAMRRGAPQASIDAVLERISAAELPVHVFTGAERVVIAVLVDPPTDELAEALALMPAVEEVGRTRRPYRLASRDVRPEGSVVRVGSVSFGRDFVLGAGAARLHEPEQLVEIARRSELAGATLFWVGRPEGAELAQVLPLIAALRRQTQLPLLVDAWGPAELDSLYTYCEAVSIGPEHLRSYPLIRGISREPRPVVLCRGGATSVEDWLLVAEQVLKGGNFNVVLCEQGIRTFETSVRTTLDLAAVAVVRRLSHLPIIANPSQAAGRRDVVSALTLGAVGAGADGVLVDVHLGAGDESSSGPQSLALDEFERLAGMVKRLAPAVSLLR
jgi:3-deoxy-7-phosphoheptulonate synthase